MFELLLAVFALVFIEIFIGVLFEMESPPLSVVLEFNLLVWYFSIGFLYQHAGQAKENVEFLFRDLVSGCPYLIAELVLKLFVTFFVGFECGTHV